LQLPILSTAAGLLLLLLLLLLACRAGSWVG
jgi:hypothetical protein